MRGAAYDACRDSTRVSAVKPWAALSNWNRSGPQSAFHRIQATQKIVRQMMNRGVPRNRAMLSEILPEASSSIWGRRIRTRRVLRGVSRRSATAYPDRRTRAVVVRLAPVLGQQVVQ